MKWHPIIKRIAADNVQHERMDVFLIGRRMKNVFSMQGGAVSTGGYIVYTFGLT